MLAALRHDPLGESNTHPDAMDNKSIYAKYLVSFGGSATVQDKPDRQIVGGKGLGLQEMTRIGVQVPPGFTLTAQVCQLYEASGDMPEELWDQIKLAVKQIEKEMGKQFGSYDHPLLFSCRSGAAISMPGTSTICIPDQLVPFHHPMLTHFQYCFPFLTIHLPPGMMDTVLDIVSCRFVAAIFTGLHLTFESTRSEGADTNNTFMIECCH